MMTPPNLETTCLLERRIHFQQRSMKQREPVQIRLMMTRRPKQQTKDYKPAGFFHSLLQWLLFASRTFPSVATKISEAGAGRQNEQKSSMRKWFNTHLKQFLLGDSNLLT
jgi:hypothetical protein